MSSLIHIKRVFVASGITCWFCLSTCFTGSMILSTFIVSTALFIFNFQFLISLSLQTVSQLFGLHLPVDITHLQALLSIIYHSLDTYLQRIYDQLGTDQLHIFIQLLPSLVPWNFYCKTLLSDVRIQRHMLDQAFMCLVVLATCRIFMWCFFVLGIA